MFWEGFRKIVAVYANEQSLDLLKIRTLHACYIPTYTVKSLLWVCAAILFLDSDIRWQLWVMSYVSVWAQAFYTVKGQCSACSTKNIVDMKKKIWKIPVQWASYDQDTNNLQELDSHDKFLICLSAA